MATVTGSKRLLNVTYDEITLDILDSTGQLKIQSSGSDRFIGETSGAAKMLYGGSVKVATTTSGISVTGVVSATGTVTGTQFTDHNNTGYYVNPSSDSHVNEIWIDDYLAHNGDGDTYLVFDTNRIRLVAGGTTKFDSNNSYLTTSSTIPYSQLSGTPTIPTSLPANGGNADTVDGQHASAFESAFSKNTAFNKNFGTAAGTVAQGNDSRINNGNTAHGWGNHASAGYLTSVPNHSANLLTSGTVPNSRLSGTYSNALNLSSTALILSSHFYTNRYDGNGNVYFHVGTSDSVANRLNLRVYDASNGYKTLLLRGDNGYIGWNGNTIWHAGNDGSGSQLDADKLDGQEGSHYLNYNNLTNKPTIPTIPSELPASSVPNSTEFGSGPSRLLFGSGAGSGSGVRNYFAPRNAANNAWDWAKEFGYDHANSRWYFDGVLYAGEVRTPIVYDHNDTAYYVNPNSTSRVSSLDVISGSHFRGANQYFYSGGNPASSSSPGLQAYANATTSGAWMSFHRPGQYAINWGLTTANDMYLGGWSQTGYRMYIDPNSHMFVSGSVRAPIFYDKDNTSYYVDPAGTSVLNGITFNGDVDFNGGANALNITNSDIRSDGTSDWTGNPGTDFKMQVHSERWYIVSGSGSNRIVQFRQDSSDRSYIANDGRLHGVGGTGSQDWRAPIFYDSNNTGYYTDPASTSRMNVVWANSYAQDNNGIVKVMFPNGGSMDVNGSPNTGAIKIRLPQSWTNTMMSLKITVYDYSTDESFDIRCGGYNHTNGSLHGGSWHNVFAWIDTNSNKDRNFTVRFGHDGTKCCIQIGETNSTWSYLDVTVTEFTGGHSQEEVAKWDDGWEVSLVTSNITMGSGSHTRTQTDRNRYMRLMYDIDNTGYLIDPAGTSRTNLTHANYVGIGAANNSSGSYRLNMGGSIDMNNNEVNYVNQLHFNDNVRFYDDGNDNYLNFKYGDTGAGGIKMVDGSNNLDGYFYADGGNIGILPPDGGWGLRVSNGDCESYHNFRVPTGSAAAPSLTTSGDSNTGVFMPGSDVFKITTGGVNAVTVNNTDVQLLRDNVSVKDYLRHYGDTNTYFRFTTDRIRLVAGGVTFLDAVEGSTDYLRMPTRGVSIGSNTAPQATLTIDQDCTETPSNGCGTGRDAHLKLENTNTTGSASTCIIFNAKDSGGNTRHGAGIQFKKAIAWSANGQYPGELYFWTRPTSGNQIASLKIDKDGNTICRANITAFGSLSDRRLKDSIEPIKQAVTKVQQLEGVTFQYKKDGKRSTGLIAQDLEKVLPEAVYTTTDIEGTEEHLAIHYGNTVGLLVNAIKEQQQTIDELTKRIEQLETNPNSLKEK